MSPGTPMKTPVLSISTITSISIQRSTGEKVAASNNMISLQIVHGIVHD